MIKSFSKYIDKIGESSNKEVVFSTNEVKEVVFSTSNSDTFSKDINVSLLEGKTFGRYKNGDFIPASGKSVKDIIIMALSEAVNEIDNYSNESFIFNKESSLNILNNQIQSFSDDPNDFINKNGQLEVPIGFKRLKPFPLDSSSVFQTLTGLQNYAFSNPTAYYGQICSVLETDSAYIIKGDGSLKQLGFSPSASIESVVYTTGNQDISGLKTFVDGINISGFANFSEKPLVDGSQVLISGEAVDWQTYTQEKSRKFSVALATGISSINVAFPVIFNSIPSVHCSIDGESDIIYQTLIKNKTTSGCSVYFSDFIQEPNFNLNINVSINTD